jgi:hypothetical protein
MCSVRLTATGKAVPICESSITQRSGNLYPSYAGIPFNCNVQANIVPAYARESLRVENGWIIACGARICPRTKV